jgi:hypothetical protein
MIRKSTGKAFFRLDRFCPTRHGRIEGRKLKIMNNKIKNIKNNNSLNGNGKQGAWQSYAPGETPGELAAETAALPGPVEKTEIPAGNQEHISVKAPVERAVEKLLKQATLEPWHEKVDLAALLDELSGSVRRFVMLQPSAADMLALWIIHTYGYHLREATAYLGVESPEKRCGKSTLLTLLSRLVNRPVVASNISTPAFFRVIEQTRPTLIIDEADTFLQKNHELRVC